MAQRYLILDYETRSEANLKKTGAYEYARHPSTQILCVAWRVGTRDELQSAKTEVWSPAIHGSYGSLKRALLDPTVRIIAHNAFFEQVITRFVFTKLVHDDALKEIPISRWECTAASAAALALPRDLEGACLALKLKVQKDMDGRKLMLKMSKPRKPTQNNPSKWHADLDDLKRLMEYCKTDINAETELFLRIPGLNPLERHVWELDQKINWRGFFVDRPLVQTVLKMIGEEIKLLEKETLELTEGFIETTNRRDAVLGWCNRHLRKHGFFPLSDLRAQTVTHAIASEEVSFLPKVKRLLEIRQAASKTSTAKYFAYEMRTRFDSRVRDFLMYWGAGPGRWTGRGLQPQNFPRGTIKDMELACFVLAQGDLAFVKMVYGPPMDVFSSCLRGMIRATP